MWSGGGVGDGARLVGGCAAGGAAALVWVGVCQALVWGRLTLWWVCGCPEGIPGSLTSS